MPSPQVLNSARALPMVLQSRTLRLLFAGLVFFLLFKRAAVFPQLSDGGEFAVAATLGQVGHQPGYPFFVFLGWIATQLFPANPYHTLAALSSLLQVVAAVLLWDCCWMLSRRALVAWALCISWLFFSPTLHTATDVEVFALHHFLVLLMWSLGLRVLQDIPQATEKSRRGDDSCTLLHYGFWLTSGLAAAHHQTIILHFPLWGAVFLRYHRPVHVLRAVALGGLGASFYLLLPYLNDSEVFNAPRSFAEWLPYVLRQEYGGTEAMPNAIYTCGVGFLQRIWAQMPWIYLGCFCFLCAVVSQKALRKDLLWWVLLLTLVTHTWFIWKLRIPIVCTESEWMERFYPLTALVPVLASAWVARLLPRSPWCHGLSLVVLMIIFRELTQRLEHADAANDASVSQETIMLQRELPQGAIFVSASDATAMPFNYAQRIRGERPDVVLLIQQMLANQRYLAQMRSRHPALAGFFRGSPQEIVHALLEGGHLVFADYDAPAPPGVFEQRTGIAFHWSLVPSTASVDAENMLIESYCRNAPMPLIAPSRERVESRRRFSLQFIQPLLESAQVLPMPMAAKARQMAQAIQSANTNAFREVCGR